MNLKYALKFKIFINFPFKQGSSLDSMSQNVNKSQINKYSFTYNMFYHYNMCAVQVNVI